MVARSAQPARTGPLMPSDAADTRASRKRAVALIAAIALSAAAIFSLVPSVALIAGFLTLLTAFAGIVFFLRSSQASKSVDEEADPDWSITRTIADQADMALAVTDRAGRLVCANDRFTKWFGGAPVPPELPVDGGGRELLSAAGRAAWRDGRGEADGVARGAATYDAVVKRAGAGEEYLVWQLSPRATTDPVDDSIAMVSGAPGRALAAAGIGASVVGAEGRIWASNPAFAERATGSDAANIVGKGFVSFLRADDRGAVFFERDGPYGNPVKLLHAPLSDAHHDPAHDKAKERSPALVLLIDDEGGVAERGRTLEQVTAMLALLPTGLALVDRDGRFVFLNDAFRKLAGLTPDDHPLYPSDIMIPGDKSAVADAVRRYATGPAQAGDLTVRMRGRGEEPVALGIAGLRGLGEAAVILSARGGGLGGGPGGGGADVTAQMTQQTKMEAVGQLAGGIAHDFNNILTAIIGHCDLMLLRHAPGDGDYDDVQQIRNNSNRAASLTRQLLAFSRQQTLRPQVLQLPDVVADVSNLLKRLLADNIELEVRHGRNLSPVRADPVQLEQVIINLGVNARDAIAAAGGNGGTISITTEAVRATDVPALGNDILPVGDYSSLVVSDTGKGIPPGAMAKIFEPFFTTKEAGKGTGLGLATVYGIVKQSGGYIFADSAPGEGATFSIYFPVHAGEPDDMAPPATAVPAPALKARGDLWGTGRVLLVEDEDMVRAVAERALTRQGYDVATAVDGEDGLEQLLADDAAPFDVIVTDVMMPNMDGPTMAARAREARSDLPILFMSGYAEEQLRASIDIDNVAFLAKPFSVTQIARAVGEILGANRSKAGD